ncbi:DUF817 family protein [Marinobacterium ramblicola]|uniref:DUF817 family protein n=1 Tax=Marinobacterium ramblicola TaxID=2849041 RepID=UPI001FE29E71|nr:DUF817 family protein [Marinobacterium ramblicola]
MDVKTVVRAFRVVTRYFLVALFIWLAENIATYANVWIYPNQVDEWHMVSVAKLSSWFMLMLLSFVLVSLINTVQLRQVRKGQTAEALD